MMMRAPLIPLCLTLWGLVLSPGGARAQAPVQQLRVEVDVVLASRTGTEVDPPQLQKMKDTFQKQNFNFTSFKRLTQQSVTVNTQTPTEVKLPNGTTASLKLVRVQVGTATLRVEVPKLSSADVELGREGSVYQRAGNHTGGELILMLSAQDTK